MGRNEARSLASQPAKTGITTAEGSNMDQNMRDLLAFRRMITPAIIQAVFWVLVGIVIIAGVIGVLGSLYVMFSGNFIEGLGTLFVNVLAVLIAPIVIRIYCELIILFFRMNETLTDIKNNLRA
jgi:hypothetical protein